MAVIVMGACTKTGPEAFKGYYSFKTGGYLVINGQYRDWKGSLKDTTFTRNINSEWGQMRIMENGSDAMKITMNITAGGPVVFDAKVDDEVLRLQPLERKVRLDFELEPDAIFTVSGCGRRYDKTIIFTLDYAGDYKCSGISGKVVESHISCIATENE